jgi:hypothetical protein
MPGNKVCLGADKISSLGGGLAVDKPIRRKGLLYGGPWVYQAGRTIRQIVFSLRSSGGPNLAFWSGARRVNLDIGMINFCIGGQFNVDLCSTAVTP